MLFVVMEIEPDAVQVCLEGLVLFMSRENHTTSLYAYADPLCSPLFSISTHMVTT